MGTNRYSYGNEPGKLNNGPLAHDGPISEPIREQSDEYNPREEQPKEQRPKKSGICPDGSYFFVRSGKRVNDIASLDSVSWVEQREQLLNGHLRDWLKLQYQDNPNLDQNDEHAYSKALAEFTERIHQIDPDDEEARRFADMKSRVLRGATRCRAMRFSVWMWRTIWFVLVAVPLLGIAVLSIYQGTDHLPHPAGWLGWVVTAGGYTVVLRLLMTFPKVDEWLLEPFGAGDSLLDIILSPWMLSLFYAVAYTALLAMVKEYTWGKYVLAATALGALAWRYQRCIRIPFRGMDNITDDVFRPGTLGLVAEPLNAAYSQNGGSRSVTIEFQDDYIYEMRRRRATLVKRTFWSLVPVALLAFVYLSNTREFADYVKSLDVERSENSPAPTPSDNSEPKAVPQENTESTETATASKTKTKAAEPKAKAPKTQNTTKDVTMPCIVRSEYKTQPIRYIDVSRSQSMLFDNLIGHINAGETVIVHEFLPSGYARIDFNGRTAYVQSQYLIRP